MWIRELWLIRKDVEKVQDIVAMLEAFWEKASTIVNLPDVGTVDIIEIIIITILFYYMLVWIKDTRAWMLLKGILVILAFVLIAAIFQMNNIKTEDEVIEYIESKEPDELLRESYSDYLELVKKLGELDESRRF